jgi:hypothetical protein
LVWGREDLRHRTALLVWRIVRGRFGEHCLGQRVRVALLLIGSEPPMVALADRPDRCRQPKLTTSPTMIPSGPPSGSLTLA